MVLIMPCLCFGNSAPSVYILYDDLYTNQYRLFIHLTDVRYGNNSFFSRSGWLTVRVPVCQVAGPVCQVRGAAISSVDRGASWISCLTGSRHCHRRFEIDNFSDYLSRKKEKQNDKMINALMAVFPLCKNSDYKYYYHGLRRNEDQSIKCTN